jgi:hypothetical protein
MVGHGTNESRQGPVAPTALAAPAPMPPWRRWTLVCALAEVVGMAAAACAAGLGLALVGEPDGWGSGAAVWLLALAGGAVEGMTVGGLQWWVLHPDLPELPAVRYVGATAAVALAGWAVGSVVPSFVVWQLAASGSGPAAAGTTGPPLWLSVAGGALMGALTGMLFGWAQAWALWPYVVNPARWVWANVWAWAVGMAVIMLGATLPSGPWPWPSLLLLGAVTGLVAGASVGAVTGLFLPSLQDAAPRGRTTVNRVVLWLLRGPAHPLLSGAVVDLRYVGRRSGQAHALPVQFAQEAAAGAATGDLVVVPGRPGRKTWWRGFVTPQPCTVTLRGQVRAATAWVVRDDACATAAYRTRWPKVHVAPTDPVVRIRLD